jgi:two-component system chemotaxis response regulator CheY
MVIYYFTSGMTKIKLLIIDDAPYVLKALRDTLEAHGYEVHEAVNGEVALARYREVDPDAKIIILTAMGKCGLEKDCIEAGASDFIMKPYKTKYLLKTINSQVLDERN